MTSAAGVFGSVALVKSERRANTRGTRNQSTNNHKKTKNRQDEIGRYSVSGNR